MPIITVTGQRGAGRIALLWGRWLGDNVEAVVQDKWLFGGLGCGLHTLGPSPPCLDGSWSPEEDGIAPVESGVEVEGSAACSTLGWWWTLGWWLLRWIRLGHEVVWLKSWWTSDEG
jgi:hypothetical protein